MDNLNLKISHKKNLQSLQNLKNLKKTRKKELSGGFINIFSGDNKSLEEKLIGRNDIERYEVNAYGRRISQLAFQQGEKGESIKLTIDTKIQQLTNE